MKPLSIDTLKPRDRIAAALFFGEKLQQREDSAIADLLGELKEAILARAGPRSALSEAIVSWQENPNSDEQRAALANALDSTNLGEDREILRLADQLLGKIPPEERAGWGFRLELREPPRLSDHIPEDYDLLSDGPDTGESFPGTESPEPKEADSGAPAPGESVYFNGPISEIPKGKVLYNPPDLMWVGKRELIGARVAKEITEGFREGLKGRGKIVEAETFVAAAMQLELYGEPSVFEIATDVARPLLLYKQPKGFAEWRWSVMPKKWGNHQLKLRISGQTVSEDGIIGDVAFEPIVKTISVSVSPGHMAKKAAKWAVPLMISAAIGAVVGGYAKQLVGL